MTIFSVGDFYLGIDKESFFDLRLHFGMYRVEWGSTTPKDRESDQDTSDRCPHGEDPASL